MHKARLIDLSHVVRHGMTTYPGLPPPRIDTHLSFDESRTHYAPGTEFHIGRMELVGNTGTYLDTPAHRHRGQPDTAAIALEACADLEGILVDATAVAGRGIPPSVVSGVDVAGRAVLIRTGWDHHWGTPEYLAGHPYLTTETVDVLVAGQPALVGIDSLNIDGTDAGTRPAHTELLGRGILIVEHLTGLDRIDSAAPFRFFATPPKVEGMGTLPVRAFALQ